MNRTDKLIQDLELELIEFVSSDMETKLKMLPLTQPRQIRTMIYNLLSSDKWRSKISFKDYMKITDVLFERIRKAPQPNEKELEI